LHFEVSSELKSIIGKELITDDFIAIYELVKNAFDAKASGVRIIFEGTKGKNPKEDAKIFVIDNGDGMSYAELEKNWLWVGYSAKKEAKKELAKNYRDLIGGERTLAGDKGIGRFSCDNLGRTLKLYTKKEKESEINTLLMDWGNFEQNPRDKFQEIEVEHGTLKALPSHVPVEDFEKGTVLEIGFLRSDWRHERLLNLKMQLRRLINPAQVGENVDFTIYIGAKEYKEEDAAATEDRDKAQGFVQNFLFETLGLKTTEITCTINDNGLKLETELRDKDTSIYKLVEDNEYQDLHGITIKLFFLNPIAKREFHRTMGLASVEYGSVFFYKNGIKINPCGDLGDDWLGLDRRKAQGQRRYLGTRDVIGRIEVNGDQPDFREVSSRDSGVIETPELKRLKDLFEEKCLRRLERYVIRALGWDSVESPKDPREVKSDSFKIVTELIGGKGNNSNIEFNDELLEIYEKKQVEKAPQLLKNLEHLREVVKTKEDRVYIDLQVRGIRVAYDNLMREERRTKREMALLEKKALFGRKVAEENDQIKALTHHVGLTADTITNRLMSIKKKIDSKKTIPDDVLLATIEAVLVQTKTTSSIVRSVLNAKYDILAQSITKDLVLFLQNYIDRVYIPLSEDESKKTKVAILGPQNIEFVRDFNPFVFVVIVDNMISNAEKAKAKNVVFAFTLSGKDALEIKVTDDGIGIKDSDKDRIFDLGFSTFTGSGIGLFYVKKVIGDYGTISVNNQLRNGVEFTIRVLK